MKKIVSSNRRHPVSNDSKVMSELKKIRSSGPLDTNAYNLRRQNLRSLAEVEMRSLVNSNCPITKKAIDLSKDCMELISSLSKRMPLDELLMNVDLIFEVKCLNEKGGYERGLSSNSGGDLSGKEVFANMIKNVEIFYFPLGFIHPQIYFKTIRLLKRLDYDDASKSFFIKNYSDVFLT